MQWHNLIPLIDNALSSEDLNGERGSLMIVGDPKQSIYLGAAFNGSRCNTLFKASVPVAEIVPLLGPIIRRYALERTPGERFGDFTIRTGYVNHTGTPADFHEASKVAPAAAPALA